MAKRETNEPEYGGADRGEWRGIYVALIDSPEFLSLSAVARLVLLILKMKLGKTGIGVFYPETLPRLTGHTLAECEAALEELSKPIEIPSEYYSDSIGMGGNESEGTPGEPWLYRQGSVFWLRNALRFEPSMNFANANHRKGVAAHLSALPKLPIVKHFAAYYGIGGSEKSYAELAESGIVSEYHSDSIAITENGKRKTETELEDTINLHAGARELAEYVGDRDAVARFARTSAPKGSDWASGLLNQFGPNGTDSTVWRNPETGDVFPAEERPAVFALALDRFATEGHKYKSPFFRRFIQGIIADKMKGESNGNGNRAGRTIGKARASHLHG